MVYKQTQEFSNNEPLVKSRGIISTGIDKLTLTNMMPCTVWRCSHSVSGTGKRERQSGRQLSGFLQNWRAMQLPHNMDIFLWSIWPQRTKTCAHTKPMHNCSQTPYLLWPMLESTQMSYDYWMAKQIREHPPIP